MTSLPGGSGTTNVNIPPSTPNANYGLLMSEAGTNIKQVFAGPGQIYDITGTNAIAANRYLKLYDRATAPNLATDAPTRREVLSGFDNFMRLLTGLQFTNGLWIAITAAIDDNDTTAIEAGDIMALNITYRQ